MCQFLKHICCTGSMRAFELQNVKVHVQRFALEIHMYTRDPHVHACPTYIGHRDLGLLAESCSSQNRSGYAYCQAAYKCLILLASHNFDIKIFVMIKWSYRHIRFMMCCKRCLSMGLCRALCGILPQSLTRVHRGHSEAQIPDI